MADKFENVEDRVEYIAEALDSMRAQTAMNAGTFDRVLAKITNQLDDLGKDESSEFMKVFFIELKKSLEDRYEFISSKFNEIETVFSDFVQRTESQVPPNQIKEVFDVIASNLQGFSRDFDSQKELISEIGVQIEAIKQDDSTKREVLKNISVLKVELEKFGNGFESIVLNLNDKFSDLSKYLAEVDPRENFSDLKKDIENVYLSSNAVLSTLQVIDRKNKEFEDIIKQLVTKEEFKVEKEQVDTLVAQNRQIADYMEKLPDFNQLDSLTEKIDTTVGVINALKNSISEKGEQNQQILTAQLDNLEKKILNISTDEEFIGFRKELSEFAQGIVQSTNLMRTDLIETNSELTGLREYLAALDIKNTLEGFETISKTSENNIKKSVAKSSENILQELEKSKEFTHDYIDESVSNINDRIESATKELSESSKINLAGILEHIQNVVNNIFSVKNAIHVENMENTEAMEAKLLEIKEEMGLSNGYIVQNSRENLKSILENIEKVFIQIEAAKSALGEDSARQIDLLEEKFTETTNNIDNVKEDINQNNSKQLILLEDSFGEISDKIIAFKDEIDTVKDEINQNNLKNLEVLGGNFGEISDKINAIKEDLNRDSQENVSNIKDILSEFAYSLVEIKTSIIQDLQGNSTELKNISDDVLEQIEALSDTLTKDAEINAERLKASVDSLIQAVQPIEENLENSSNERFLLIKANLESLAGTLKSAEEKIELRSQNNISKLALLFEDLSKEYNEYKEFLNDTVKVNFSQIQTTIADLPDLIKQNQLNLDNDKRLLIEENSKSIEELNGKIQNLINGVSIKESAFKEDVLVEFSDLKSLLDDVKQDLSQSSRFLGENVGNQLSKNLQSIEDMVFHYDEKYGLVLMGLKNQLTEYFNSLSQINHDSGIKIDNSLQETADIKNEMQNIIETLADLAKESAFTELSVELGVKLEGLLLNITQLEGILAAKNESSLRNVLNTLDEKFETISSEITDYKNILSSNSAEIISDLGNKLISVLDNLKECNNLSVNQTEDVIEEIKELESRVKNVSDEIIDSKGLLGEQTGQIIDDISDKIEILREELKQHDDSFKINEIIEDLGDKFDDISAELKEYKNVSALKASEFIDNLEDKVETIKTQLNITGTDVINVLDSRADEIIKNIEPISEAIDKILAIDFNNIISDIKTQIEDSNFALKESLQENIKNENAGQIEILSKDLDMLNNKAEEILLKLSSDDTDELDNIKSVLDEVVQGIDEASESINAKFNNEFFTEQFSNLESLIFDSKNQSIESINEVLEKVLQRLENDQLSSSFGKVVNEAQEQVVQKLNTIEANLLKSQKETKATILDELNENIISIKDNLSSLNIEDSISEKMTDKISRLEEIFDTFSQDLNEKLSNSEEEYKTSTQSLLSDVKGMFSEKIEDILDDLKSFIEVVESKRDFTPEFNELKDDIFDRISQINDNFEDSIAAVSVKQDLEELSNDIEKSINDLLEDIQERFIASIENNQVISELTDKTDEINKRIENVKEFVIDDFNNKFADFELNIENYKKDFSDLAEELKASLAELKESYIDLGLNSTMEISNILIDIQGKVEVFEEKFNNLDIDKIITDSKNQTVKEVKSLKEKLDLLSSKSDFEDNLKELNAIREKIVLLSSKEDFEDSLKEIKAVNEKLDSLISKSDFEESLNEIKAINQKLDLFALSSDTEEKENLNEIKSINQKLDLLSSKSDTEIKENVKEIKQIIEAQNSFLQQLEKIKGSEETSKGEDFASIKTDVQNLLQDFEKKLDVFALSLGDTDSNESTKKELDAFKTDLFENFVSLFNQISFVVEAEDIKDFIDEKTEEIKKYVNGVKAGIKESEDYSYTLQDVESDIAKVRLVLNEIVQARKEDNPDNLTDFEKLNKDIVSISSRTNKLLLNSDELHSALKDFKKVVKESEKTQKVDKIEKKLEKINQLALSSVKSDKIFNQTFMYLAEWVDSASENFLNINDKLDGISEAFEKQQAKITMLEKQVEKLTSQSSIKAVVAEVLAQMGTSVSDGNLSKKIDNIENKLEKFSSEIEKITAYVD